MTNAIPRLSIITATFNASAGLRQTVESVIAQTRNDEIEHIVIDGGSSDGSVEYLQSLGDRVRWISEPDGGIADALNKGVTMATGDYILVLQAEDVFASPNSVNAALAELESGADIVAFDVRMTLDDGRAIMRRARPFGWLSEFKMTCPHQGMFCRRDLFDRIGLFDTSYRIAMDYEWFLRAKRAGAALKAVSKAIAVMPATGISTQTEWQAIRARLSEDRRLQRRHAKNGLSSLLNRAFWWGYMPFKHIKSRVMDSR